jgi:hypothetical protein
MFSKGIKKYLLNPSLGLLSLSVFFLLCLTNDILYAFIFSLLLTAVLEMFVRIYTKTSKNSAMFLISFVSLLLSFILWLILKDKIASNDIYIVLPEIFTVGILTLMRLSRSYIRQYYESKNNDVQDLLFENYFNIVALTQYIFTLHIFISLICELLHNNDTLQRIDSSCLYVWMPAAGIIVLIIYEHLKTASIYKKLKKEIWLPIVNEKGEVSGKIVQSETFMLKNKYLHPVVRVALVCKGKLYLQSRDQNDMYAPGTLDHPFEKYMLFKHDINDTVQSSIVQVIGKELPVRFLLKYTYDGEVTRRLIFLFASVIEDEKGIDTSRLHGKFWTTKQIDADFGDNSKFSESFQLEYEYLKNTIITTCEITDLSSQANTPSA